MKKKSSSDLFSTHLLLSTFLISAAFASTANADEETDKKLEAMQGRIDALEQELDQRVEAIADAVESSSTTSNYDKFHLGGYGEMHYNSLDQNGVDKTELDVHRVVLFLGYDFNDKARFVSEFEIEHVIASGGSRGAVELEQVYLEFDLKPNMHIQTGALLMPIGIINETHEPPTFYGVERPVVESTIIPTTWWSGGAKFDHEFGAGWRYDIMVSEGLKTEDPNSDPSAEPFNLKLGKQKASFADAYDLAITGRLAYRGIPGLEVAAYAQYQPDLDQSAEQSYADSATLFGGHIIYQLGDITTRALYARWDLDGTQAMAAGKDVQDGGYLEVSWRPSSHWGVFVRQSAWSQTRGVEAEQTDLGINFYPYENIVFKADYQLQNDDAGNTDGFNLGVGYHF